MPLGPGGTKRLKPVKALREADEAEQATPVHTPQVRNQPQAKPAEAPKPRNLNAEGKPLPVPMEIRMPYVAWLRLSMAREQLNNVINNLGAGRGVDVPTIQEAKAAVDRAMNRLYETLDFGLEHTIDMNRRQPQLTAGQPAE